MVRPVTERTMGNTLATRICTAVQTACVIGVAVAAIFLAVQGQNFDMHKLYTQACVYSIAGAIGGAAGATALKCHLAKQSAQVFPEDHETTPTPSSPYTSSSDDEEKFQHDLRVSVSGINVRRHAGTPNDRLLPVPGTLRRRSSVES